MGDDAGARSGSDAPKSGDLEVAERVRRACVHVALSAYEDAGVQGLCAEGRWERAIDALRSLDLSPFLGIAKKAPREGD
jgi:hypothetical protein